MSSKKTDKKDRLNQAISESTKMKEDERYKIPWWESTFFNISGIIAVIVLILYLVGKGVSHFH